MTALLSIRTRPLFLLFLTLWAPLCAAGNGPGGQPLTFTYISVEDGLSQSTVTSIVQDREGLLWFATADGLNRYDGVSFTVFKHDNMDTRSILSNVLAPLALSGTGTIWIGTSTGLCRYDKSTNAFTAMPLHSAHAEIALLPQVTELLADRGGLLWVGTLTGLMVIAADSAGQVPEGLNELLYRTSKGEQVSKLYEDREGIVWIAVGERLVAYRRNDGTITEVALPGQQARIFSLLEDGSGTIWAGTDDSRLLGYRRDPTLPVDRGEWQVEPLRSEKLKTPLGNFVTTIAEGQAGELWVGTRLAGLLRFDRTRRSWEECVPPIPDQRFEGVTVVSVDRSGLVWVGYDGAGIVKIDPNAAKFHHILLPKTSAAVSGDNFLKPVIVDHTGRLWIGTYDKGLTMLDRASGRRVHYVHDPANRESLSSNSLLSLAEDDRGRLWIGTVNGIDRLDGEGKPFRHFGTMSAGSDSVNDGDAWCLAADAFHSVWAATGTGVLRFDELREEFVPVVSTASLRDNWATCLAFEPDSTMWIGTAKTGILHAKRTGEVLERFSMDVPGTLPFKFVKCLTLLSDGVLWIGMTEGLSRYDTKAKTWRSYYQKDGLPDESVYGILPANDSTLWFSTNRGIVRMTVRDPAHPLFRNYTPDDGLQSYEFNTNTYCKSRAGEFFFGGINGLNSFFPDSVRDNPHVPNVVITGFKIFDQPANLGQATETVGSITLRYTESVFSFEFAALEYTNPRRNNYAYMMEGYDRDWVLSGNRREARYTNLDPGEYVFRVRGSNSDGVWNDRCAAVKISIVPPFWRTSWFYAVAGICLAGAFGGAVRYLSVRKLRRTLDAMERANSIEEHRRATREGIARDLHDDVSSTLSSMSLFAEASKLRVPPSGGQGAGEVLARLHAMAREAEDAMEQAVWSLSPHHQRLSHLVSRIHDVAIEQCREQGIACAARVPLLENDCDLSDVARKNCFLIFREGLANVLRHSGARSVELTIDVSENEFHMLLKDDGRGFDPALPGKRPRGGNGLKNMASRAAEIGGTLAFRSAPGTGTTLSLSVQLAQMRY